MVVTITVSDEDDGKLFTVDNGTERDSILVRPTTYLGVIKAFARKMAGDDWRIVTSAIGDHMFK